MVDSTTAASGFVLEDVPHLSDYIPHLPVRLLILPLFKKLSFWFEWVCLYYSESVRDHTKYDFLDNYYKSQQLWCF